MLQTSFRGNHPAGSGEEDFEGFLPYMGVAATLVTRTNFRSPFPRRFNIKFGFDQASGFREDV